MVHPTGIPFRRGIVRPAPRISKFAHGRGRNTRCDLLKRGIVVTAAHCVARYGSGTYFSNWQFVPGHRNGEAPFEVWSAASATVPSTDLDGSDACYSCARGVGCENDVALLTLSPQNGDYAGSATGWDRYG